jgi:hypothetical protein
LYRRKQDRVKHRVSDWVFVRHVFGIVNRDHAENGYVSTEAIVFQDKVGLSSTEGTKTESQIASISDADIFSASSGRDNAKKGSPVTTKATTSYDSNIEMGEVKKEFSFTKGNKTESDSLQTIESTALFSFPIFSSHPCLVDIV